jgi:succinate dehydrogenase/fumarate reductase flavoprotein subunit
VRIEVIETLTRSHFVRVTAAEQAMINRASEAEHQAAAVAVYHAHEAKRLLEEMGILRAPSVLDVTRADVHALGKRADALRRAMRELDATGVWRDDLRLGQVLKVARREQVRAAVRILREGGHQIDDLVAE